MSAVGLGKGFPAPSHWRLPSVCGGMESGPETPAEVLGAGSVQPPGLGWVPPARATLQGLRGGMVLQGPHLSWSLRAESSMGSFPSLEGPGCCGGQGVLAPLSHGQPCWGPGTWPVPSHPTASGFAACLRSTSSICSAPTRHAGAGLSLGARIYSGGRNGGRKGQRVCVGSRVLPGGCTSRRGLWWVAAFGAMQHDGGVALEMGPVPDRGTCPPCGSMCGDAGPPAVTSTPRGSSRGCGRASSRLVAQGSLGSQQGSRCFGNRIES